MNDELWRVIVREAIASAIPVLMVILGAWITGLSQRLSAWLEAKKHGELTGMVATGNAMLQSAMENEAGRLALQIRRGEIDPTNLASMRQAMVNAEASIRSKMPDTIAKVQPTQGSLADGVEGKLDKALPPPAPVDAAEPDAPALQQPISSPSPAKVAPNRKAFFDGIRSAVFGGRMVQSQVDGCERILDFWNAFMPEGDRRHLAYILATVCWETGHTMQPIEEYGRGAGHPYGASGFYGRGLVQLTLKENYQRMSPIAGCDLVANPEKALEWPIALKILFAGMTAGMFTGKKLSDFFDAIVDDPVKARAIINGTDRAEEVAVIHKAFLLGLTLSVETIPAAA